MGFKLYFISSNRFSDGEFEEKRFKLQIQPELQLTFWRITIVQHMEKL